MNSPACTVVTLASTPRLDHLRNQLTAIRRTPDVATAVVWVGEDSPPPLEADHVFRLPPGPQGLRLAAARNAGADWAVETGSDVIIFLDADCVPGPDLVALYTAAALDHSDAVLCGPVTYLPPGAEVTNAAALAELTAPHAARPSPPLGEIRRANEDEYPLFWSLSFAMSSTAWSSCPRFDERYEGYGGEDTDFAFALRASRVPMLWVGGAHAYHQHHPTQSPPWQHLDDILRNGEIFADRWGEWPMRGWLEAFADAGAVQWDGSRWRRTGS